MGVSDLPPDFPDDFMPRARRVLLPFARTVDDRDDLLTEAFLYTAADSRLYYNIEREGKPRIWTIRCLHMLMEYGCLTDDEHAV